MTLRLKRSLLSPIALATVPVLVAFLLSTEPAVSQSSDTKAQPSPANGRADSADSRVAHALLTRGMADLAHFGGIRLNADGRAELSLVGNAESLGALGQSMSPKPVIRQVARTYKQLVDLRDRITAEHNWFKANGLGLVDWGPDEATNTVKVGITQSDPSSRALVAQRFGAEAITVVTEQPTVNAADRVNDYPPPWYGGDRIFDAYGDYCTAGIPVQTNNPTQEVYFITAAHCWPRGPVNVYNNGKLLG